MKLYIFILSSILITICALSISFEYAGSLNTGDFVFSSISGEDEDDFSIVANELIPPFTLVHFTDSEWNGNHFGIDESSVVWNSGEAIIPKQTKVIFKTVNTTPKLSHGTLSGTLKISSERDAIFAYIGNPRMPIKFISATANNPQAYGTLINTALELGSSAITFSENTCSKEEKPESQLARK